MKLFSALTALLLVIPLSSPAAQRLVTIGGGVTESVFALGLGQRIVATDTSSTWPVAARTLPKVGYARSLAAEGILAFAPDLILASDLAGPPEVLDTLRRSGVPVLVLPTAPPLANSMEMLRVLARELDAQAQGQALLAHIQDDLDQLPAPEQAMRVLALIGGSGGQMMAAGAGTRADAMLRLAGAENVARSFSGYRPIGAETLMQWAPQALIIPDHALAMLGGSIQALRDNPAVAATPAGQHGHIVIMDGLLLLGMGPRVAEAARQLQQALAQPGGRASVVDAQSGATPSPRNEQP